MPQSWFHLPPVHLSFINISFLQYLLSEIPLRANKYQVTIGKFISVSDSYLLHFSAAFDAIVHTTLDLIFIIYSPRLLSNFAFAIPFFSSFWSTLKWYRGSPYCNLQSIVFPFSTVWGILILCPILNIILMLMAVKLIIICPDHTLALNFQTLTI